MPDKQISASIARSRRSLRILYGGVVLLVLTVVMTAFFMMAKLRQEAETNAVNHAQNIATSLNLTLKGLVDSINVALALSAEEISEYISGPVRDHNAVENVLRRAKRQNELNRVAFVRATDENGNLVYGPGIPKPYISLASRKYFIQLKNDPKKGLVISQPIASRVNGKWIWLFARRINKKGGTFGGVVYSYFFVDEIGDIFSQIKIGDGSSIELRDANLRLVGRYISPGILQFPKEGDDSLDMQEGALGSLARTGSFKTDGKKVDGVARIHAFHRNDMHGFVVNVGVTREAILAKWQKEAWGIAGMVAAFIAVSVAFAVLIRIAWLRQEKAVYLLESSTEALEEAQKISNVGHYSYNFKTGIWDVSEALGDILGIDPDAPRNLEQWMALIVPESRSQVRAYLNKIVKNRQPFDHEYRITRPDDNTQMWVHDTGELQFDRFGNVMALFGTIQDISKLKEHEEELQRIANFDVLTGVPNRRLLADRLNQAVARADRGGNLMAVCYVDLDNFKPINDRYGHAAGDHVLVAVTEKLKKQLRTEDTVARLGGDEFVLIFADLAHYDEIRIVLDRVLDTVRSPIEVAGTTVELSASLGVTLYPSDNVDADTLLRHADQAMYRAKESGKNRYHLFDSEYDRRVQEHRKYQEQVREGLKNDEFFLVYQPKVDLVNGEVIGVEALIRWQHPEKGVQTPGDFFSFINGSDFEIELGEWVIDTVLEQIQAWSASGLSMPVSVNISAKHLLQTNFAERLKLLLNRYPDVTPSDLELEVLETAALTDVRKAAATLAECRDVGVQIALDDFGTGYSSLTYFRQLPVQVLKIDKSFVGDMLNDSSDLGIVESVVWMANTFNRKVIAEGVETLEHGAMLVHLGCRLVQGYGIAYPMRAAEIPGWVAHWRETAPWRELESYSIDSRNLTLHVAGRSVDDWVEKVAHHVVHPEEMLEAELASHQCPFGIWHESTGASRYGHFKEFKSLGVYHKELHDLAIEIIAMVKSEYGEAAKNRLAELYALQDEIKLRLQILSDSVASEAHSGEDESSSLGVEAA